MTTFKDLALALPLAEEMDHFGSASFRVAGKIFAQLSADGETGLVKLTHDQQAWAIATLPEACAAEPQWGRHGWTRLKLSGLDEERVRDFLTQSWGATAPKKMRVLLG